MEVQLVRLSRPLLFATDRYMDGNSYYHFHFFKKCKKKWQFTRFTQKNLIQLSANLTSTKIGIKGENTRNFEANILTSNKELEKNAVEQFDSVWMGSFKS